MERTELLTYAVIISLTFLFIVGVVIWLLATYFRVKVNYLKENTEKEKQYHMELAKARSEIQHDTLNTVGKELHDNIGQLLAVAKIYSNELIENDNRDKIERLDEVIEKTIAETRALSHSLNIDSDSSFNLVSSLEKEVNRINNAGKLLINFESSSGVIDLIEDKELMIFRIIQEFITNSIRHSQAELITIKLLDSSEELQVNLADNGIGFDTIKTTRGTGISNIRNRVNLLNGIMELTAVPDIGTTLKLSIPKN